MKIPERLIGFVTYEDQRYPFEFESNDFMLKLYPPTDEIWKGTAAIQGLFPMSGKDAKKHEWIGQINIEGIAPGGNRVLFCVQNNKSNYNGFYSFNVNWYFYYYQSMPLDGIDGFSLSCDEINYYFSPMQALESQFHFSKDQNTLEKITVESNKQVTESCGKYRILPHIDAEVEVMCYAIAHTDDFDHPINATSKMVTTFSTGVKLETVIDAYRYTKCFLQYVTYRRNINIQSIPVFCKDDAGKRDYLGILVFSEHNELETHDKKKSTIISHFLLRNRAGLIFTNIKNGKIGLQHICKSIEDTTHYPSSRIIMIFSSFEREFRNIYGEDVGRSQEYIDTKNEVVNLIDQYSRGNKGKKRTYAKQLSNYVANRDSSFEFNLKKVLLDNEKIMGPFVKRRYSGTYNEIIDGISQRMCEIRNGIAHSRLDLRFDAIHLSDIKIVEEIIYVMRLKRCHLNNLEVQKSINSIFRENFAL